MTDTLPPQRPMSTAIELADDAERLANWLDRRQSATFSAAKDVRRYAAELRRLAAVEAERDNLGIDNIACREAVEHALRLVEAFAASPEGDDDMSQGAARATRRRLNEALGKLEPRLMFESELGPKYSLHYKDMRAERDALRALLAESTRLLADALQAFGPCDHGLGICNCDMQRSIDAANAYIKPQGGTT